MRFDRWHWWHLDQNTRTKTKTDEAMAGGGCVSTFTLGRRGGFTAYAMVVSHATEDIQRRWTNTYVFFQFKTNYDVSSLDMYILWIYQDLKINGRVFINHNIFMNIVIVDHTRTAINCYYFYVTGIFYGTWVMFDRHSQYSMCHLIRGA